MERLTKRDKHGKANPKKGTNHQELMERLAYYEDLMAPIDNDNSFLLYLPDKKEFLFMEYGSGDNLLNEDRAAGYVDYINIQTYSFELGDFEEEDGGMLMLTAEEQDKPLYQHINGVLIEMFDEVTDFIVLQQD